jgi:hypothetical protein
MMYYDGTYFLSTETSEVMEHEIYAGASRRGLSTCSLTTLFWRIFGLLFPACIRGDMPTIASYQYRLRETIARRSDSRKEQFQMRDFA